MADPATMMCNNTDHSILVATIGEQTRLITQLFGKIQDLERKLELAQEAARNPIVAQSPPIQAPNFAASAAEGSYVSQQDYSSQPPSAYESKKAHAQSQPCSYGSRCTREQCWYDHSGSTPGENSKSSNSANQSQTTGNSSKRIKQECKYGINCTRKQCWFEHPSDWVSPNSETQESQPQQEFGTEPPAAEASNWGTNEDSSGWGAPPSNDWGVPVDNTWGPSTEADNGWGNPAETSWNSHSGDQHKSPVNNSRSTSVNMSREGSVSNASTNKSQGRGRKARGKGGRRADSESIATESTPMSPSPLATTFTPADVEPITIQTPFSAPIEPTGQTPSYNETNLDEMSTPPLEPSVPSLSSEPEAPATPKALWSDEPTIDVVHFPETPLGLNEPPTSESFSEEQAATEFVDESFGLDQSAPSDLYSSWGVTGVTASDWGLDPTEFPDPTPTLENKTSGKKSKSKGKGKQKESSQTGTAGYSTPSNSSNYAAQSETSLPSINEVNHLEPEPEIKPTPDPPKGVPQDEIPDWLLGADEDAHAVLGIPRSTSPHPETSAAPPRLAPTNPAPRPPLSKLAAENFPALGGLSYKPPQTKDDTSSTPAFTPRPVGWKITRSSDTSSTSGKSGKGSKPNSDWGKK